MNKSSILIEVLKRYGITISQCRWTLSTITEHEIIVYIPDFSILYLPTNFIMLCYLFFIDKLFVVYLNFFTELE